MKREVPRKNYLILTGIIIVTFILLYYFYMWYLTYEESKLNSPIMNRYLQVIKYNELDNYVLDNNYAYIYTGILEDEKIRKFEIEFKNLIKENSLKNKILYLNLTDIYNNKKELKEAKNKYTINNNNISNVPCILVFENGSLIDIYNIKDNNYDIDLIKNYLIKKEVIK